MILLLRSCFLAVLLCPFNGNAGKVEIDVQHVGQGNCVLVKFSPDDQFSKYMLVDLGSSSFKTEMSLEKRSMDDKKSEKGKDSPTGKIAGSKVSSSPVSDQMSGSLPGSSSEGELGKQKAEEQSHNEVFIENLRKKLGPQETPLKTLKRRKGSEEENHPQKPPISIQTVVITHPDKDHYGWLTTLFTEEKDHIEHLIFGGLPEHYDASETMKLKDWIGECLDAKTRVYFPAISYTPIDSMEEVLLRTNRPYASHRYSSPESTIKEFDEAFNFGKEFSVHVLSVNPTHTEGKSGTLRLSDPEDDNVDSLVLKIVHGGVSAILTGDATGVTTTRIIDNYSDLPEFLQTNVLLASHHGSSTHGSNNEAWIQETQPEIVLISNGLSQGHPHEEAYKIFKKSLRLMKAVPVTGASKHEVFTPDGRRKKTCTVHATKRAIFSTVTSYGMTVTLNEKGIVDLATLKEGEFKLAALPEEENEEEIVEAQPAEREGHLVLVSSSQDHSSGGDSEKGSVDIDMEAASSASPKKEGKKKSRKASDTGENLGETGNSPEKSNRKRQKTAEDSSEGL